MQYWVAAFRKYAVFTGRARRSEYWFYTLFNLIFAFTWGVLVGVVGALAGSTDLTVELVAQVFTLVTLLPTIAVSVRRLHDTGRSGWWVLVGLVPLIGWIVLICFFVEDSQSTNRYGPNPKAVGGA